MSRGKRFSRRWAIQLALAIVLGGAAVACVSVSDDVVGRLVDQRGRPAAGAYIAYYYSGARFNFAHPVTATRPGAIARSGADGTYRLPPLLTVKPPLDSSFRAWIELVYAPPLHNAFGPVGPLTESVTGVVQIDRAQGVMTVADLTGDPDGWARSIERLYSFVRFSLERSRNDRPFADVPPAAKAELAQEVAREYRAFLHLHGAARREPGADDPSWAFLTEDDREQRRKTRAGAIARDPLWGPHMERLWRTRLEELARITAGRGPER
jgi:hypothetical protein